MTLLPAAEPSPFPCCPLLSTDPVLAAVPEGPEMLPPAIELFAIDCVLGDWLSGRLSGDIEVFNVVM